MELVPGTAYTFNAERTSHHQNNPYSDYVACFTTGTRLTTPNGFTAIEDLAVGDLVRTKDDGDVPLRWIGHRTVPGYGAFAPIRILAGWKGRARDLVVSPQHRMLIEGAGCQLAAGFDSSLVSELLMTRMGLAYVAPSARHLLLRYV